jgi:hypothetical protein
MILTEQVYAQACVLADTLDEKERQLLRILCRAAVNSLSARLRDGLTAEDLKADFIAAASLYALAAMSGVQDMGEMKLGDVTLKRNGADTASKCLQNQAALIMAPYLRDGFSFRGV